MGSYFLYFMIVNIEQIKCQGRGGPQVSARGMHGYGTAHGFGPT